MTEVVIVDDQTINLKILSFFAASLDADTIVRTFDAPIAALEYLSAHCPDLIVTDYVMPTLTGEEFIRRCRLIPDCQDVPIIVVTAYEDRAFRYTALEAGASDFLLSPVDGQEFCTRARNLLLLWRQRRELRTRASVLEGELAQTLRQHAEDIRRREEQLRRVVNTVPALIRASDVGGRMLIANSFHSHFFDAQDWETGRAETDLFGEAYGQRHSDLNRHVFAHGRPLPSFEESVILPDGSERVLLTTKAPICDGGGAVDQVVTVSLDITDRKAVEQAIAESEERFRRLVEGSVLGIVIEQDGVPVFANRMYASIFGYDDPQEILARCSLDDLFAGSELHRLRRLRQAALDGAAMLAPKEFQGLRRDGSVIWVEIKLQAVSWNGASALQSTVADVSLRKAYEQRLQRQANYDDVTGLPNRVLATDRLRSAVLGAVRHRHKGGLLFLDLDQFKKINDTWGHAIGDELLRLAANRLRACVREEDTVARLGGDEFTIILPKIGAAAHTEPVVHKILQAFSQPFVLDRHEAFVTASIGVSIFPDDSDDPATLMQNADAAMYRAKEEGRNTFQFFTPELNARAAERMRLEHHLVHALAREEFSLHYQPIIDIRSGRVVSAEALLRWSNPEVASLSPERFVPLIEDIGLIAPVGVWVLDTACRQLSRWHQSGQAQLGVTVNVSARQLRGCDLVETVQDALRRYNLPPQCLELEITESCLMTDLDETTAALRALDRLGVAMSVDDFGTGYSCLRYLKDLPVDTVKIDKSFILNVSSDSSDASVVEAIIALAHRLGIRVVGEGVETESQLAFIRSHGCDYAQGYYFSKPLPAEQFADWSRACNRPLRHAAQA
jgi:diguanylate cyclase (GGDEF)-like protein/PAS domain S-box-containing protein